MARVVGIDPGTLSIDVCGMEDGHLYLDHSWPTSEALSDPSEFIELLTTGGPPEIIIGPSGYGLPLQPAAEATDNDLLLAFLAPADEPGGIGGLRSFARILGSSGLPVFYAPGVIHLDTVPAYRKLNRVDLGTADKLCAVVLGIRDQCKRRGHTPEQSSFILMELGGAFTAGVAVERGQAVDGVGGTSGPIGWQAAGALDGEVAFLAREVTKSALFQGGISSLLGHAPERRTAALDAYVEGVIKTVRQLRCSAPSADEVLLSGRHALDPNIHDRIAGGLANFREVRLLTGSAVHAKQGAEGAALLADGLAGGANRPLVERLRIREARGTVLDHLLFVTPEAARRRLGLDAGR